MTIIGLVGYPNTGKDTIAESLNEQWGYERVAFGDAVKELLLQLDPEYLKSHGILERYKREGLSYTREKLQNLGQFMRDVDNDYWVDKVYERGVPKNAVFTDIRYANELAFVQRNFGGVIFGVTREGTGPVNNHTSERNTTELLTLVDYTITNDAAPTEAATEVYRKANAHLRYRNNAST